MAAYFWGCDAIYVITYTWEEQQVDDGDVLHDCIIFLRCISCVPKKPAVFTTLFKWPN